MLWKTVHSDDAKQWEILQWKGSIDVDNDIKELLTTFKYFKNVFDKELLELIAVSSNFDVSATKYK